LSDINESIKSYQQAIKIKPDYSKALLELGAIYESKSDWSAASNCYYRLIGTKPDNVNAYLRLARTLLKQDKIYGAISAYQEAIQLRSNLPAKVYKDLGDLLTQIQANKADILAAYQKASELKSDWQASFYLKFGDLLMEQEQFAQAITQYQKALELKSDFVPAYLALGDAYLKQKDLSQANHYYQKALQLKSDSALAYKKLAMLQEQAGQFDQAIQLYQKVLEIKPETNSAMCRAIGNILIKQGRLEEAKYYYDRAI
ncbi:MAG: tetratricopeptide repeat protein, partial [Cyanobacteria bacterium J083]